MIQWLIAALEFEVARAIVSESAIARSSAPHSDPVEAAVQVNERLGRLKMNCCVDERFLDMSMGRPSNNTVQLLYDAWLCMECPGLVDSVVVATLIHHGLFERWMAAAKLPNPP